MLHNVESHYKLALLVCPDCHTQGNMASHGFYKRTLVTLDKEIKISVKRVKCLSCNKTHALLPQDVIPYKVFSQSVHLRVIFEWACGASLRYLCKKFSLALSTLRRILAHAKAYLVYLFGITPTKPNILKVFTGHSFTEIAARSLAFLNRAFAETHGLFHPVCQDKSLSGPFP